MNRSFRAIESPEIHDLEKVQIGGSGTFKVQFIHLVGHISAHTRQPIFGSLKFLAQIGRIREDGNIEIRVGMFMQSHWDLGGSYLGLTRSNKKELGIE